MGKKVTIKDIAERAGVSTAAVSMVLNNKPCRISSETKARIIDIARELNYLPNQFMNLYSSAPLGILGLIVPDSSNLYMNRLAAGVERVAEQNGYCILRADSEDTTGKCMSHIAAFSKRGVSGIIIIPSSDVNKDDNNKKMLEVFNKSQVPMILLDGAIQDVFCDFITLDNQNGGMLAAEYLIKHGHKNIGCIMGPLTSYCARKRFEGFCETVTKYGLPGCKENLFEGKFDFETGRLGAERLLKKGVTGIFAGSDVIACGVYQFAQKYGLKIPEDISVIGFDDTDFCSVVNPPLTAVRQPAELMGRRACEILLEKIAGNQKFSPKDYFYAPTVTERKSVGFYSERDS